MLIDLFFEILNFASSYLGGPIKPFALFETPTGSFGIPKKF